MRLAPDCQQPADDDPAVEEIGMPRRMLERKSPQPLVPGVDQEVGGFEVAGDDHNFVTATARIEKVGESDTVVVSCPKVQFPRFVRYDWSGVVTTYLYNRAGLPAGTFTSE